MDFQNVVCQLTKNLHKAVYHFTMTETDFFTMLYPIVPLIGIMGFLPQIITLLKADRVPASISLSTWSIWTLTWLISFGYATFALQDILFATTCGLNLIGHFAIIGLTVYKRQKYKLQTHTPMATKRPARAV